MTSNLAPHCLSSPEVTVGLRAVSTVELFIALLSLCTSVVFAVTISRYRLLTNLSKVLLVNECLCSFGYLSLRLITLVKIVYDGQFSYERTDPVRMYHDFFVLTKYNMMGVSGIILYLFSKYTVANFGRSGLLYGLFCSISAWTFAISGILYDPQIQILYVLTCFGVFGVSTVSVVLTIPFKRHLATLYTQHKFDVRNKTMVSIQLRSLTILKSALYLSLARMFIGAPILTIIYAYLAPACMIAESRYVGALHDIIFESFDTIIPVWTLCNEPVLRKKAPCIKLRQNKDAPMRNALGQKISLNNDGDRHFEELKGMWETARAPSATLRFL